MSAARRRRGGRNLRALGSGRSRRWRARAVCFTPLVTGHLRVAAPFPVFAAGANSIVIRLIGPFEFVDRRENSADPLSNEFDSQDVEIASYHTQSAWPFHGKKRDFRCIGLQECSGAVPLHRCVQSGLWDMVSAKAGAQGGRSYLEVLDSRLRGKDG